MDVKLEACTMCCMEAWLPNKETEIKYFFVYLNFLIKRFKHTKKLLNPLRENTEIRNKIITY